MSNRSTVFVVISLMCLTAFLCIAQTWNLGNMSNTVFWDATLQRAELVRASADNFGPVVMLNKIGSAGFGVGSAVKAADEIGGVNFLGWDTTTYSSGAAIIGIADENFTPTAWGSRLIFRVTNVGTTTQVSRLELAEAGLSLANGTPLSWTSGAEPTCDVTQRGKTVFVAGGAGVADTFRICSKDATDTYAWRSLQ